MLTLVMSVATWAADPYFQVVSGSLTSGTLTVKVTIPDATTIEYDGQQPIILAKEWSQYQSFNITVTGNTFKTTFTITDQVSDDMDGWNIIITPGVSIDGNALMQTLWASFVPGNPVDDEPGTGDGDEPGDDDTPAGPNYFWVKNLSSDSYFPIGMNGADIEYTLAPEDDNSWAIVDGFVLVEPNNKMYFRAGESGNITMSYMLRFEEQEMPFSVGGDITTLLTREGNVKTLTQESVFANMFQFLHGCQDASELVLPSTTLSSNCYESMFMGCENLTSVPELPATTLAPYCYNNMFYDCSSLQKAPVLPATKLVEGCYKNMFYNCSNLSVIFAYVEDYENSWGVGNGYWYDNNPMQYWVDNANPNVTICTNLSNWAEGLREQILGVSYNNAPLFERQMEAKQDPDHKTEYYTTFFDSKFAYEIPAGVTAYTATIDGSNLLMTPIEGDIIPAGEGVLLKTSADIFSMNRTPKSAEKNAENIFQGTDEGTSAPANCYVLSYGQNQLGFYQYSNWIDANKAYVVLPSGARSLRMVFAGEESADGIENVELSTESRNGIFSINGARLSQPQKGLNIINGRKVLVK